MILISPHADWFQYLSSFQYSICSHTDTKMELFNIFPLLLLHCLFILVSLSCLQVCLYDSFNTNKFHTISPNFAKIFA